jgi:hypothetical protein
MTFQFVIEALLNCGSALRSGLFFPEKRLAHWRAYGWGPSLSGNRYGN